MNTMINRQTKLQLLINSSTVMTRWKNEIHVGQTRLLGLTQGEELNGREVLESQCS